MKNLIIKEIGFLIDSENYNEWPDIGDELLTLRKHQLDKLTENIINIAATLCCQTNAMETKCNKLKFNNWLVPKIMLIYKI